MAEDRPEDQELQVTFSPALFLQRRAWVFDILRREKVTQVLDVGCGEGETFACLCNPAPWLPLHPIPQLSPSADQTQLSYPAHLSDELGATKDFLHIRRAYGLDILRADLEELAQVTKPPSNAVTWQGAIRWEPLEVKIWHGGMESFNPEFVDIECIISTEVIEHLPEDILPDFAPMLLGVYHPRLLLISTPSYTYNARFTSPNAPSSARRGIPDPTGRTDRIFRHWDHKFEWTVKEFTEYCESVANQWGYDVEVSGVGVAQEEDPWHREKQLGFASQVAAFKRKDDEPSGRAREAGLTETGNQTRAGTKDRHDLIATHHHEAHHMSGHPSTLETIGELVKEKMTRFREPRMTLHELWVENDVSIACGGWLQYLIAAVEASEGLSLHKTESQWCQEWIAELNGYVEDVDACSAVTWPDEEISEVKAPRSPSSGSEEGDYDNETESWPVDSHTEVPEWDNNWTDEKNAWNEGSWNNDDIETAA